ncbi:MAG TPA: SRPBCC family protein [Burkholderiales bacterium]|jgi:mxaD protein|nr:SRPBCC family protein [Burkholderiales bacterium]
MKTVWLGMLAALTCIAVQAWGADANELSARQSIRINAPAEAVWAMVGNFNGSPRWLPLVERSEIVFGANNRVGAIRLITRRDGTKVTERLLEHDPQAMRMAYTYIDGAVRASDYFPVLSVKDAGDGTSTVEWSARFKRLAYAVDPPPPGQDDQTMTDFYNALYKSGLESLKRVIEGGQ